MVSKAVTVADGMTSPVVATDHHFTGVFRFKRYLHATEKKPRNKG